MQARLVVGNVKKHYTSVHIPVDWTHNVHVHDFSILKSWHFCSLYRDVNSIIFENLHFETHFQKLAFSEPQNAIFV